MQYTVTVAHDEEEGVWFVQSSDIPGLNAEAPSLTGMADILIDLVEKLIGIGPEHLNLMISRPNGEPNIVLPLTPTEGLGETLHLLSTPANTDHLLRSIAEVEGGNVAERSLIEP